LPLPASFAVYILRRKSFKLRLCLRLLPLWHGTMSYKVKSYLRTFRRRSGLTQAEVAFLLGVHSGAKVSRYERLSRRPSFQTALGLQAVFGIPAETLLPAMSAQVERKIVARAYLLSRRLERHSDSARTKRKIRFLTSVAARGTIAHR